MLNNKWLKRSLEEISQVGSGGTPNRAEPKYWGGSIPWVTTAEVDFCEIKSTNERITDEGLQNSSAKLFPVGTILMAMYGQGKTRGKVAKLGIVASTNQACAAIILQEGFYVDFYYQYLSFRYKNIRELSNSGSQENLSGAIVKSIIVPVPPLPEQQKIAQILSTWDKAISTTEQLLANSQQQKKALMQQLLTGQRRLLDDDGVMFSGEWEKGELSDIANIDSGYAFKSADFTDSENGIPIIRMSDFKTGGVDISSAAKVIPETTIGLDRFKLKTGDFVFGMSGSLSNYGWVKDEDLPCYLNQRVGRILAKKCAVQLFVTYLYLSDKIQQSILDKAAGAAQLNISSTDLRKTIVYYPSFEEQQKIAAVLSTADQEISTLQQQLATLKQEKKALMQQLLTGKVRVKLTAPAGAN